MGELSWIIILLSWFLFFAIAYALLHYFLFKDYELRGKVIAVIFSMTFSTSCTLLELFLLDLSLFQVSHITWKVTLLLFSALMLYIIPFYLMFLLLRYKYLLWILFIVFYSYLLEFNRYMIGYDTEEILHFSLVEQIKLLGINGVIMSAFLSGFGAINCTYAYFNFFSEDVLKVNIKELIYLCKKNVEKITEAKVRKLKEKAPVKAPWKSLWGVFSSPSDSGKHETEINALEAVHQQYLKNIQNIIKNQEKQQIRNSLKGKIYYFLGRILTIYSIYKVIISSINYFFKRRYSLDPVSRTLQIFSYFFAISPDLIYFVDTYVSFAFIGLLIFTNIRSFLLLLLALINICARLISAGLFGEILMVIISEVTGAYFMATVLLMRANLPEQNRAALTYALSGIDFNTFHHMFDAVFTISAILTAGLLYMKHKLSFKSKLS